MTSSGTLTAIGRARWLVPVMAVALVVLVGSWVDRTLRAQVRAGIEASLQTSAEARLLSEGLKQWSALGTETVPGIIPSPDEQPLIGQVHVTGRSEPAFAALHGYVALQFSDLNALSWNDVAEIRKVHGAKQIRTLFRDFADDQERSGTEGVSLAKEFQRT